jgi:hypothetical protein
MGQTNDRADDVKTDGAKRNIRRLHSIGHPDCKRRGEASEAAFLARACSLNLPAAKLWGESNPIDILVGNGTNRRQFWRVQVKCANAIHRSGGFEVPGGGHHLYTEDDIDFLAAHIIPKDLWYIVPIHAFLGRPLLYFYPNKLKSRGRYEKYRETWCLLACTEKARGWKDIPVLCRCKELAGQCAVCPRK